jgi:hypothetical protein
MTPNSNYHVLNNSVWATVTSVSLLTSIYYFWFIMQSFIHKIKDDGNKEGYIATSLFYLHVNNVGYCEYPCLWTKATSLYMCNTGRVCNILNGLSTRVYILDGFLLQLILWRFYPISLTVRTELMKSIFVPNTTNWCLSSWLTKDIFL